MFDPHAYGPAIARILALEGDGRRPMPLARAACASTDASDLIAAAPLPGLLRAGLYLYFSCWDEAHEAAQDIASAEGSYWHAIVHRQEPDAANSRYWFQRVGAHPIFPALRTRAAELGYPAGARWDPVAFIAYCEGARPGSPEERIAREVQLAEWQLLFDHCARQAKSGGAPAS